MPLESKRILLIGLGNPGTEYEKTYHNVGHMLIDFLAGGDKRFKKEKLFSYQHKGEIILAKTSTYMNESGAALHAIRKHFASKPGAELILAHDDSDLTIGTYKLVEKSGAAGHKGVESVMQVMDGKYCKRIRIGIRPQELGEKKKPRLKAGDFVLRTVSKSDRAILYSVFEEIKRSVIEKTE